MKNLIQKIGFGIVALGIAAGAKAYAESPITFADQKAYDDIATADDVIHGAHVNKSITTLNGATSMTYFTLDQLQRSDIPSWKPTLYQLGKMADKHGNNNGIVEDNEAEALLLQAYVDGYKRQNQ